MSRISSTDLERVKRAFYVRGESISEWARAQGFEERHVYAVLSGRNKATRGQGHAIAVRLGLKAIHVNPTGIDK